MTIFSFVFRSLRKINFLIIRKISNLYTRIIFYGNGIKFRNSIKCNGIPKVNVHKTAILEIGENCRLNSSISSNPIGRFSPIFLIVRENAYLKIGNNVGISSSAIICQDKITIDDNVMIGGGVCIYDTDFHSLDNQNRRNSINDQKNKLTRPIRICQGAFIGAHATILKGVTIGENSIIGACSVVTKDIPANEIWAGNPARFIKKNVTNL